GKSAVVFPAAFASSVGSFFSQPENVRNRHAPSQIPAGVRRRRSRLSGRNAFTEPSLISLWQTVWQDNSGARGTEVRLLACLRIGEAGSQAAESAKLAGHPADKIIRR